MHPGHALVTLMARRRAPARLQMGDCNISIQLWPSLFACNGEGCVLPPFPALPLAHRGRQPIMVQIGDVGFKFRWRPSIESTPRADRGLQPRQLGR